MVKHFAGSFSLSQEGQNALKLSLTGNNKFFQDETITIEYNNADLDATQKLADQNGNSVTLSFSLLITHQLKLQLIQQLLP